MVGRAQEEALVVGALRDVSRRAVVIGGHAGVGKTRLARAVADAWADGEVVWLSASAGIGAVPFGAVARLLPEQLPADVPGSVGREAEIVRAAAAAARATPDRLVVVDDVHALDVLSALLVQQLVLERVSPVLLTVRSAEPVPSAVEGVWRDGFCDRVDLLPLARREADLLVEGLLGGAVAAATASAWFDASGGSPLLLEELVRAARDAGTLQQGADGWVDHGGRRPLRHVREVIESRIGRLEGDDRDAVALVALGPPLSVSAMARLVPDFDADDAARRGLVAVEDDSARVRLRLSHPLVGEAVLAGCPAADLDRLRLLLADELATTGGRRSTDVLMEARLRLDADDVSKPELFVDAARAALGLHAVDEAASLAEAARRGGSSRADVVLGGALALAGRPEEAIVVLEEAFAHLDLDSDRVVAAYTLQNIYDVLGRHDDVVAITEQARAAMVDPVWAAVVAGNALQLRMMTGATRAPTAEAVRLLAESDEPRVRLRLVTSAGGGQALAGRSEAAIALATEVLPQALALQGELPMAPAWVVNVQAIALLMAGRLVDAQGFIDAVGAVTSVVATGDSATGTNAYVSMMQGRIGLARGRVAEALDALVTSSAGYRERDIGGFLRMSCALEAEAWALSGDLDRARDARDQAFAAPLVAPIYEGEVMRSTAWVLAIEGRLSAAIAQLVELAALQELEGQLGSALHPLHDAVRLGAGAEVGARLVALAEQVDGAWPAAFTAHVHALRSQHADDLDAAGDAFVAIGADLLAAEAYAEAARAARTEGLAARAAAALRQRDEALARCGPLWTPTLSESEARAQLTGREREIVALAARGLTDRAIAEELVVSVRTVEGHLHRAFAKLGVTSRGELPGIVGDQNA